MHLGAMKMKEVNCSKQSHGQLSLNKHVTPGWSAKLYWPSSGKQISIHGEKMSDDIDGCSERLVITYFRKVVLFFFPEKAKGFIKNTTKKPPAPPYPTNIGHLRFQPQHYTDIYFHSKFQHLIFFIKVPCALGNPVGTGKDRKAEINILFRLHTTADQSSWIGPSCK